MRKALAHWIIASTFAFTAETSQAMTINPLADTQWNVDYYYPLGTHTFHIAQIYDWDGDTAQLHITTTFDALDLQAALMSFGFNLSPDLTNNSVGMEVPGDWFDRVGQEGNLPSIDNNIDVCVWSAKNCSGGNINQGLSQGMSDSVTLSFSNLPLSMISFDLYGVKVQSSEGSFEFRGCERGCGRTEVTEPGTLVLLSLGVMGLVGGRRWLAR